MSPTHILFRLEFMPNLLLFVPRRNPANILTEYITKPIPKSGGDVLARLGIEVTHVERLVRNFLERHAHARFGGDLLGRLVQLKGKFPAENVHASLRRRLLARAHGFPDFFGARAFHRRANVIERGGKKFK